MARLPDEVLQRILEHAIGTRSSAGGLRRRQWLSAGDLQRTAHLGAVCRRWRTARQNIITRFTFFALPCAAGHSTRILHELATLPALRALQLFVRPAEAATFAVALRTFLARPQCRVHTVHLCMPPLNASSAAAERAVAALVAATAAGAARRLTVLSLDSCGTLAPSVLPVVAEHAPHLATLALDCTICDWRALAAFPQLAELSLRNCSLDDDALEAALCAAPALETLALGYCGPDLGVRACRAMAACRHLRSVELARCAGVRNDGVLALANVSSLSSVALLHVDVSADALVRLARAMGPRLTALCVTSVRTGTGPGAAGAAAVARVAKAARMHCPNLRALDFAQRRGPHWSERAYAEALRFAPQASRPPPVAPATLKAARTRQLRWSRFFKAIFPQRRRRSRMRVTR